MRRPNQEGQSASGHHLFLRWWMNCSTKNSTTTCTHLEWKRETSWRWSISAIFLHWSVLIAFSATASCQWVSLVCARPRLLTHSHTHTLSYLQMDNVKEFSHTVPHHHSLPYILSHSRGFDHHPQQHCR